MRGKNSWCYYNTTYSWLRTNESTNCIQIVLTWTSLWHNWYSRLRAMKHACYHALQPILLVVLWLNVALTMLSTTLNVESCVLRMYAVNPNLNTCTNYNKIALSWTSLWHNWDSGLHGMKHACYHPLQPILLVMLWLHAALAMLLTIRDVKSCMLTLYPMNPNLKTCIKSVDISTNFQISCRKWSNKN